jgi:hypothetical protein
MADKHSEATPLVTPDAAALAAFGGESGAPVGPRAVAAYLVAHGRDKATDKTVRRVMRDRAQVIIGRAWPESDTPHRYKPATAARLVAVALASGASGEAL